MGGPRTLAVVAAVLLAACGSSGTPARLGAMPDADESDGGAGGLGGVAGAGATGGTQATTPDANATGGDLVGADASAGSGPPTPDASTAPDLMAAPPDAAALGPFPLDAVKALKPALYASANAHLEGPSFRDGEIFFAADGAGWGLMRVDANRKLYRYQPKLTPVGSYLLGDGSLLLCDHDLVLVQLFADGKVAQLNTDFGGQAIEYCNDVTVDGAGNVYLSGRHTGIIYRVSPAGEVVKVATGLNLPNGVEVDPGSKYLYAVIGGNIARIALPADGGTAFGKPEMLVGGGQPDGLAFDAWGNLWIADWKAGHLTVMGPDGQVVATIPTGGGPINLTFGADSVFVLNDFKGVFRFGPVPGLRGFLHPGAPKYQIKKMLDIVPANTPVP
jgi:sugar lactone lactonase YvrE